MNRYSSVKDTTGKHAFGGTGASLRRLCWTCSKPRPDLGGKTNPRTLQWSCAACLESKK